MRLPHFVLHRLHRIAERIMEREPDQIIGPADNPYLVRWYVSPHSRWFNIYLHRVLRSDEDRALHDHPWVNCSILIAGYYIEHTIAAGGIHERRFRVAGDVKLRLPTAAHRLEIGGMECWTFFLTGPNIRAWGFHCPEAGWRHWKDFVVDGGYGETGRGCGEMGDTMPRPQRSYWPWQHKPAQGVD
jgi:hypothetical protein